MPNTVEALNKPDSDFLQESVVTPKRVIPDVEGESQTLDTPLPSLGGK